MRTSTPSSVTWRRRVRRSTRGARYGYVKRGAARRAPLSFSWFLQGVPLVRGPSRTVEHQVRAHEELPPEPDVHAKTKGVEFRRQLEQVRRGDVPLGQHAHPARVGERFDGDEGRLRHAAYGEDTCRLGDEGIRLLGHARQTV